MVTMRKNEFKLYLLNVIEHMDEDSEQYQKFCEIFLTMCGVVDAEGNLTEPYKCSPYWQGGDDGTPLRASANAELIAKLSDDVRQAIIELDGAHA